MGKRALVIGGTGLLGFGVMRELLAASWQVTNISRGKLGNPLPEVPLVTADRNDPAALRQALGDGAWDLVVDCAAFKAPQVRETVEMLRGRVGHYVFISTDFTYAPDEKTRFPVREDAAKIDWEPYGVGKLDCERALKDAEKFPYTVLRPPHILGAGKPLGCDPIQGRDPKLLEIIREGKLQLLAEGLFLVQPVFSRDVGACAVNIAGRQEALGKVYNCAGRECVLTREYYAIIAEMLGVELRFGSVSAEAWVKENPNRRHIARHRIYDMSALAHTVGFVPRYGLREAIAETFGWMGNEGNHG